MDFDTSSDLDHSRRNAARHKRRAGTSAWDKLRRLTGFGPTSVPEDDRTSAELTTQPAIGRGQALREAHRTLRRHFENHPALRSVAPHLAAIEAGLGKRGSRVLATLPVPVLRKGLMQLAMLHTDDESAHDAASLRVLRLRLMEAIDERAPMSGRPPVRSGRSAGNEHDGLEVRHISVDEFHSALDDGPAAAGALTPSAALPGRQAH